MSKRPIILVVPGTPSRPGAFSILKPYLGALDLRIITFPGYEGTPGRTENIDDRVRHLLDQSLDAYLPFVIGFSGGFYAAAMAIDRGMSARALLGLGPSRGFDHSERVSIEQAVAAFLEGADLRDLTQHRMVSTSAPSAAVDEVRTWLDVAPRQALAQELLDFAKLPDLAPVLARLDIPVHLLVGERDVACPPNAVERLAGELTNVSTTILSDVGHACFLEAPEAVAEWIMRTIKCIADGDDSEKG